MCKTIEGETMIKDSSSRKKRVIMAKPGLDGHWRAAMIISAALRDAGMEVIYMGNQTPAAIVECSLQEDVDAVGLSILAASHMKLIKNVVDLLKERNMSDVPVVVGGTIPQHDIQELYDMGVKAVFPPGSKIDKIVDFFLENI
jgi:methylmalonyl-CoA mutase C-terminal domain/subunit